MRRVTSGALTNSFIVKVQEPGPETGKHFILFLLRKFVESPFSMCLNMHCIFSYTEEMLLKKRLHSARVTIGMFTCTV